jgi:hypothetical protein
MEDVKHKIQQHICLAVICSAIRQTIEFFYFHIGINCETKVA